MRMAGYEAVLVFAQALLGQASERLQTSRKESIGMHMGSIQSRQSTCGILEQQLKSTV